mmetsp:Transcript_16979/g.44224  ORF Transcript_16979/g.44224 Transcript_16979/m.44224 type:complete len:273 (+) Transcript_16979:1278-2096(+)
MIPGCCESCGTPACGGAAVGGAPALVTGMLAAADTCTAAGRSAGVADGARRVVTSAALLDSVAEMVVAAGATETAPMLPFPIPTPKVKPLGPDVMSAPNSTSKPCRFLGGEFGITTVRSCGWSNRVRAGGNCCTGWLSTDGAAGCTGCAIGCTAAGGVGSEVLTAASPSSTPSSFSASALAVPSATAGATAAADASVFGGSVASGGMTTCCAAGGSATCTGTRPGFGCGGGAAAAAAALALALASAAFFSSSAFCNAFTFSANVVPLPTVLE